MLAANYLAQKDEAQWLATMKRVLDQPDYGLFHGRANQQIAEHFMETGRWAKARPYAEAGANTGAGWALVTLAKCCEGSGDWNAAEELIRQEAERYDKPMSWARFCLRTGHGNLQAATAAAKQYLDHPPGTLSDRELLNEQASYFIMMGDAQAALEPLKAATDRMGDPYAALHLALLLDAAGDTAGRDGALRIAVERGPQFRRDPLPTAKPRECFLKLAALFQQCLAGGAAAKLDTHTTDALIESSRSSQDKVNLNYFIARFLELRGDDSGAMPYLKKAAANRNRNATACVMAWIDLRRRGIDPAQIFIAGDDAGAD
jgi:tetratricopeptide (TPR) repeat protein